MFERITAGVIKQLSGYIGQGLHGGLRACNQATFPSAMVIYELLPTPEYGRWHEVCEECAWSAAKFAVGKHKLKNSGSNRGRLSYLLARTILRKTRSIAKKTDKDEHHQVYNFFSDELGMPQLRAFVEPTAEHLLSLMVTTPSNCPDCRRNERLSQTCDLCGHVQCSMHCACTRDDSAINEATVVWRKRLEEYIYHLPDVETVETPDDAPLTQGTFVFHTYDDDHPHFEVCVRPWRPDEEPDDLDLEESDGE
jgi:hypothetical protein